MADSNNTTDLVLPIVDLAPFLTDASSPIAHAQCLVAANALITYGAVLVHDPRVPHAANDAFLDLLEDYFAQPTALLARDQRPELGYQVGVTLENTERPRCASHAPCLATIARLDPAERPLDIISAPAADPKSRFFWRIGDPPAAADTAFPLLNAHNVIPDIAACDIKTRWPATMSLWGTTMRGAVDTLADMLAVGLGLEPLVFRAAGARGAHLLAPTASDLHRHGKLDTVLAGFHTDLNFLTIHGRSRYPGLNIWARNTGRRIAVRIPQGNYLLVQAGTQLEHVTGGLIRAGYHEVVVNKATLAAVERRQREAPDRPLIRISSTFFWHLESDYTMRPIEECVRRARELEKGKDIGPDRGYDGGEGYPEMKVGEFVQK